MNEYQEALDWFRRNICEDGRECNDCDINDNCSYQKNINERYTLLQKLVNKRTPKKVKSATKEDYEESGYRYCCPACGKMVGTKVEGGVEQDDYCCSCGQRLDWSDEDE